MTARGDGDTRRRAARRRARWLLGFLVASSLLVTAFWLLRSHVSTEFPPPGAQVAAGAAEPLRACVLYRGGAPASGLATETRFLPWSNEIEHDARTLIASLGALSSGVGVSPWPAETVVQDLFVSESGILYVNFGSALRWRCPRGDRMEWLVAATLTRTLCDNLPGISGVRILIDGESTGTLVRTIPLDEVLRPAMFAEAGR